VSSVLMATSATRLNVSSALQERTAQTQLTYRTALLALGVLKARTNALLVQMDTTAPQEAPHVALVSQDTTVKFPPPPRCVMRVRTVQGAVLSVPTAYLATTVWQDQPHVASVLEAWTAAALLSLPAQSLLIALQGSTAYQARQGAPHAVQGSTAWRGHQSASPALLVKTAPVTV